MTYHNPEAVSIFRQLLNKGWMFSDEFQVALRLKREEMEYLRRNSISCGVSFSATGVSLTVPWWSKFRAYISRRKGKFLPLLEVAETMEMIKRGE